MTSRIFSYKYPIQNSLVKGNMEQWTTVPVNNASTTTRFTSKGNSTLIFNLASNAQFMRTHQTYLAFAATCRDAAGNPIGGAEIANITNSRQGCTRLFQNLFVCSGSSQIENVEFAEQVGQYYSSLPLTTRNWLTICEGFNNTQLFATTPTKSLL